MSLRIYKINVRYTLLIRGKLKTLETVFIFKRDIMFGITIVEKVFLGDEDHQD